VTNRATLDIAALNKFIRTNPSLKAVQRNIAEAIMEQARANAPAKGRSIKPDYVRRFTVKPWRNQYRVWNEHPFAGMVELGSKNNPVYAPIRRAARASGQRFVPGQAPST
jgi:hypothetical protein